MLPRVAAATGSSKRWPMRCMPACSWLGESGNEGHVLTRERHGYTEATFQPKGRVSRQLPIADGTRQPFSRPGQGCTCTTVEQ
eukprot:1148923-Pelagomonas_calceolata.AAC.3